MEINIIRYIFIFNIAIVGGFGLLLGYMKSYLPAWLTQVYFYGKYNAKVRNTLVNKMEVPKKWFKHFYIFAGPASTIIFSLAIYMYFYNGRMPEIVLTLLDISFGASRKPLIPLENLIIATMLYQIQCWKRLYETTCVSVFSNQKINVLHYLLGYMHYIGTLLCLIGESQGFVRGSHINRSWNQLSTTTLVCALIFLWSAYMQLHTNLILARLRKNKDGAVVSHSYNIPFHGLFKYISSPLQFTEILMYFMLSLILWQASTYHYITFWVITNQIECACVGHQWYHNTFKDYPRNRKIVIPFVW